jgi:hypothetical protein
MALCGPLASKYSTRCRMQVEDATDTAFFRKYRKMDPTTKDKIRKMADLIGEDE